MRLVFPSVKILSHVEYATMLSTICTAISHCYKADFPTDQKGREEFVRKRLKAGHETVIEHHGFSVDFCVDRGITHELVRHRLCAFTQSCVVGGTVVHPDGTTIRQLWDKKQSGIPQHKTHLKTRKLRSVDSTNRVVPNGIADVFQNGIKPVVTVKTAQGYSITCTLEHEFMRPDGNFSRLEDLSVGDYLMVNGRPCLLSISDDLLCDLYLKQEYSPLEIAELFDVPYRVVLRKLHILGIFVHHKNDKSPEKYNKNHTAASFEKMRASVLAGFAAGREVWNKGVVGEDSHSYGFHHSDEFKQALREQRMGSKNPGWKNGIGAYRRIKSSVVACELCGEPENLEVHHIDGDRDNNDLNNLLKVCVPCHRHLHFGWHVAIKAVPDIIVSIEPVGDEEVFDLEMAAPMHNYIADGFVVHNSTRYCNYSKDKFGGHVTFVLPPYMQQMSSGATIQPGEYNLHLGTGKDNDPICALVPEGKTLNTFHIMITNPAAIVWLTAMSGAEQLYLHALQGGEGNPNLPPEYARAILPNSTMAEITVTANLREWRHIFKLRALGASGRPHPQMLETMRPLLDEAKRRFPVFFEDL